MKTVLSAFLLLVPAVASAQTATIKIDVERVVDKVDPKIFGVFMEPIHFGRPNAPSGNTLYGTFYDPCSALANADGFRTDYIEAGRELKITNMRWPGGNFVAGYNWQDGIGPKEKRPVRKELAWGGLENNHVGTDEWVALNRALGSQNVVCINLGTGTLDDARYWVEYCNSEPGSHYADLRVKYGHEQPFNIKYWCLGNEVDGASWIMGYKNAEDYCKIAKEAAKVMRYTDRDISFVANGSSNYDPDGKWVDWNWKVINAFKDVADYLSIHRYWEYSDDYDVYMGQRALDVEEKIVLPASQIATVRAIHKIERPIYISFDEWAPHGRGLMATLATAQYLNAFIRHADVVKMANFTLFTSLLGRDRRSGTTFKTPLFHTFKLFSHHCRGTALDVFVDCDTFDTSDYYQDIPYLDVSSVYVEETGSVTINVVNRHREEAISTEIVNHSGTLAKKATVHLVNGDDIRAPYTIDNRQQYVPATEQVAVADNAIAYTFPAHSFTQIIVKLHR